MKYKEEETKSNELETKSQIQFSSLFKNYNISEITILNKLCCSSLL